MRAERRTKTNLLQVRLQATERETFQIAADLAGLSLSSWVRERLRQSAVRELEGAGLAIPFLEKRQERK